MYLIKSRILSQFKAFLLKRPLLFINILVFVLSISICLYSPPRLLDIKTKSSLNVLGEIVSISDSKKYNVYTTKIFSAKDNGKEINIGNYVRIYIPRDKKIMPIGNIISTNGTFYPNEASTNDGGFNSLNYYYSKGQTGFIIGNARVVVNNVNTLDNIAYNFRKNCEHNLDNIYSEEHASILKAILLGNKSEMLDETKNLYIDSGIIHILAISGLHLSLISNCLYNSLIRLKINCKISSILCLCLLFLYVIVCGKNVSLIRAYIMIFIKMFANILGKRYDPLNALCISIIFLLLRNPYYIYDSGFIYTILCVATIQILIPKFNDYTLLSSVYFQFATIPLILSNYYVYPIFTIIINILIIPFVSPLLILGFLSIFAYPVSVYLSLAFAVICKVILNLYSYICNFFKKIPFSILYIGKPYFFQITLYCFSISLLFLMLYKSRFIIHKERKRNEAKKKTRYSHIINSISHTHYKWFSKKLS